MTTHIDGQNQKESSNPTPSDYTSSNIDQYRFSIQKQGYTSTFDLPAKCINTKLLDTFKFFYDHDNQKVSRSEIIQKNIWDQTHLLDILGFVDCKDNREILKDSPSQNSTQFQQQRIRTYELSHSGRDFFYDVAEYMKEIAAHPVENSQTNQSPYAANILDTFKLYLVLWEEGKKLTDADTLEFRKIVKDASNNYKQNDKTE